MLGATSAIAVVDAVAKYLSTDLHGVQVAWGYFLGMLLCLMLALPLSGTPARLLLRSRRPLVIVDGLQQPLMTSLEVQQRTGTRIDQRQ